MGEMMRPDDFERIRAVLRRYTLERVPVAATTPDMALDALQRIEDELERLSRSHMVYA